MWSNLLQFLHMVYRSFSLLQNKDICTKHSWTTDLHNVLKHDLNYWDSEKKQYNKNTIKVINCSCVTNILYYLKKNIHKYIQQFYM